MLNERCGSVFGVRGNCDAEIDQMVLRFPIMAEYCLLFSGGRTVFVTHGHLWNRDGMPPLRPGDVLLHGHTHVPCWEETEEGVFILNPGSVSIPKDGSVHGYMLLDESGFVWKNLDGEGYHRLPLT